MEDWDKPRRKHIDKKTGREVVTTAPHSGFSWREGFVLRRLTPEERDSFRATETRDGAFIGDNAYEWVPRGDVELDE